MPSPSSLPPAPGVRHGGRRALAGSATTAPCTSSTGLRQLPDTSNSFSRFPQAPGSCSYILTPALPLLTTQEAPRYAPLPCPQPARSGRVALPDGHGAHAWHRRAGAENTQGTDGQTKSTCVSWMQRPGAHVWHQQTDQEHTRGAAGWARSTRMAPMGRLGAHACHHRWREREHTRGTAGWAWSTHVALTDRGAHACHGRTGREHTRH